MQVLATNLGFPRIGAGRQLKKSLERYWAGEVSLSELVGAAAELRRQRWQLQSGLGLDHIPSNDFSLYDHVLDTAVMVGALPERYQVAGTGSLERYFAMARGGDLGRANVTALEMTKWFDTNYHYLVPELASGQRFELGSTKAVDELAEAAALGISTRPVLLGPVTFLLLSKRHDAGGSNLHLVDSLTAVYAELLGRLQAAGATWAQLDEPALGLELGAEEHAALRRAYATLREAAPGLRLLVATYFAELGKNLPVALSLPVDALHLDAVAGPVQAEAAISEAPPSIALSLGVVDGRNVWRSDLGAVLDRLEPARDVLGPERLMVAPSCSLMHLPVDLSAETELAPELREWLAFAVQRLQEVTVLARGLNEGREAVGDELEASRKATERRGSSRLVHDAAVGRRLAGWAPAEEHRPRPYAERKPAQSADLDLPLVPTTTIGSFPQTSEVRSARARYRQGKVTADEYDAEMRGYIRDAVALQEDIGLDVLVHGEPERNDMVEYFAELLEGCAVTLNGWVQSYGSRCVKPPVIFGDVSRPLPMTLRWATYAQSLTSRPVKGMLTGPVTILQWSFVRNDQPLAVTARQVAYAIRDEVDDLQGAGIKIVQVDEPALREGLPLGGEGREAYLEWAVSAFRLATAVARDETQVHTHMCYVELSDIMDAIVAFDADVISLEASRSQMELLDGLARFEYPNEIGPGIWDVHSPRVPSTAEMAELLRAAAAVVAPSRLWANPDCGLKTRRWEEVRPALQNLVGAAVVVRRLLEQK